MKKEIITNKINKNFRRFAVHFCAFLFCLPFFTTSRLALVVIFLLQHWEAFEIFSLMLVTFAKRRKKRKIKSQEIDQLQIHLIHSDFARALKTSVSSKHFEDTDYSHRFSGLCCHSYTSNSWPLYDHLSSVRRSTRPFMLYLVEHTICFVFSRTTVTNCLTLGVKPYEKRRPKTKMKTI